MEVNTINHRIDELLSILPSSSSQSRGSKPREDVTIHHHHHDITNPTTSSSTESSSQENTITTSALSASAASSSLNDQLRLNRQFTNPTSISHMMQSFHIPSPCFHLVTPDYFLLNNYEILREKQNKTWAQDTVALGITHAKAGNYKKAMHFYEQAIDVYPLLPDAFVARGAAYANLSMLEAAIEEFKKAVELEPSHPNALKYLDATQTKKETKNQQQQQHHHQHLQRIQ
eukprot:TRINITY_DN5858_c1_g1_i1.p1 TRINITY_DN5858_c1_g1~~TRINITY_DN5858_c1_g1_i1.p1  ORF type:complete len:230 (-),score=70.87 TRINITY_DN5858_c1_g1_i1:185-874(-)